MALRPRKHFLIPFRIRNKERNTPAHFPPSIYCCAIPVFANGYKDLSLKNIRKVYITPGTIGNLGFYDKEKNIINYLYVKLNPAGESPDGIEAWKLINKDGCFLYILFTCGNAFYPNGERGSHQW